MPRDIYIFIFVILNITFLTSKELSKNDSLKLKYGVEIIIPESVNYGKNTLITAKYDGKPNSLIWNIENRHFNSDTINFSFVKQKQTKIKLSLYFDEFTIRDTQEITIEGLPLPEIIVDDLGYDVKYTHNLKNFGFKQHWYHRDKRFSSDKSITLNKATNPILRLGYELSNDDTTFKSELLKVFPLDTIWLNDEFNIGKLKQDSFNLKGNNSGGLLFIYNESGTISLDYWNNGFKLRDYKLNAKTEDALTLVNNGDILFIDEFDLFRVAKPNGDFLMTGYMGNNDSTLNLVDELMVTNSSIYDRFGEELLELSDFKSYDSSLIAYENKFYITDNSKIYIGRNRQIKKNNHLGDIIELCFEYIKVYDGTLYFNKNFRRLEHPNTVDIIRGVNNNLLFLGDKQKPLRGHDSVGEKHNDSYYGNFIMVNGELIADSEIDNIIKYHPNSFQFIFEFEGQLYSQNTVTSKITIIKMKGEYINHLSNKNYTWVLTKEYNEYYIYNLQDLILGVKSKNFENHNKFELFGKNGNYKVSDLHGNIIFKGDFVDYISFSSLKSGIYIVNIITNDGKTYTKKIIRY